MVFLLEDYGIGTVGSFKARRSEPAIDWDAATGMRRAGQQLTLRNGSIK
jgi:hypothetical protein